jgi:hypothetical protein
MIVPTYWSEARKQHRQNGKQVTIRRFGWSDISESEAAAMAESRASEALARRLKGQRLPQRDQKVAYGGASGIPIREEILGRQNDVVITRNGYGARCLNTPDVLFADVDFQSAASRQSYSCSLPWPSRLFSLVGYCHPGRGLWPSSSYLLLLPALSPT